MNILFQIISVYYEVQWGLACSWKFSYNKSFDIHCKIVFPSHFSNCWPLTLDRKSTGLGVGCRHWHSRVSAWHYRVWWYPRWRHAQFHRGKLCEDLPARTIDGSTPLNHPPLFCAHLLVAHHTHLLQFLSPNSPIYCVLQPSVFGAFSQHQRKCLNIKVLSSNLWAYSCEILLLF